MMMNMKKKLLSGALALSLVLSALPALPALAAEAGTDTEITAAADAGGVISFENLQSRILTEGLAGRALEEGFAAAKAVDFDALKEYLRLSINSLAATERVLLFGGNVGGQTIPGGLLDNNTADSFQQAYASLQEQMDAITNGERQKDVDNAVRGLENSRDQLLAGGEKLYFALTELEATLGTMRRGLATLDRTVEEMTLRHALGQISDLTLEQVLAQRVALNSQLRTMEMNISVQKLSLEQLCGAPLSGESSLSPLPALPEGAIEGMDLAKDLEAARKVSYDLFSAKKTLDDARKEFQTYADLEAVNNRRHSLYLQAEHKWNAAQLQYESSVQQFEMRFRVLYLQVKDNYQIWAASQAALETEKLNLESAMVKHSQGEISDNKLADALDAVESAQDKVDTAYRNLFSKWNDYRWAVERGLLN